MNGDGRKSTVTLVGTLPPIKGISPYCAEYARTLAEQTEVEFLNFKKLYPEKLYPGGTSCEDMYPVDLDHPNLKIKSFLSWYNPLSWIRAGLTLRGDIVHAQWWSYPLAPVYVTILTIARMRRKKVILTVHNVYPHERGKIKQLLNMLVLRFARLIFVHTEKNKEELVKLGYEKDRIEVIPHMALGRDILEVDRMNLSREEAKRELGLEEHRKVLCFFGNIREYKGLDELLLALGKVKLVIPDISLIIAGQPWVKWEKYEKIIGEQGLEDHVIRKIRFLPFDELLLCLKASDLVVFPFKELHSASGSVSLALSMGSDVMS
ncbi:MAG: glycosyltransferase, partial [Actinomycetota bacterium]